MYESVEVLCILERMDELFVIWMLFLCLLFVLLSFIAFAMMNPGHCPPAWSFPVSWLACRWEAQQCVEQEVFESKLKPMCGNGVEEKTPKLLRLKEYAYIQ